MDLKIGHLVTFWYKNCEYLGKIVHLNKQKAILKVVGADADFIMRFGRCISIKI